MIFMRIHEVRCARCNRIVNTKAWNTKYCFECASFLRKKIRQKKYDSKRYLNLERREKVKNYHKRYNHSKNGKNKNNEWRRNTLKGRINTFLNNLNRYERRKGVITNYSRIELIKKMDRIRLLGICPQCKCKLSNIPRTPNYLTINHFPPIGIVPKGFVYTLDRLHLICTSCNCKDNQYSFEKYKKELEKNE